MHLSALTTLTRLIAFRHDVNFGEKVRVQTGLEVEAGAADVTDVRFVSLLMTSLVVLLHVGGEVQDGGQHGIAHLALQVHGSLGVVLGRGPRSLSLNIFRKVNNGKVLLVLQLVLC